MISTGLQQLDDFLRGGIRSGVIVDIFGNNGTGKTQLILQICVNSIKNNHTILYFDTTGEFRPERILELQKYKNISFNILDKITVSRLTNTAEQIESIDKIRKNNFSVIIIDNITDLFSYEYQKNEQLFEKNTLFMKYMHDLSTITIEKNISTITTNTVRTINDQSMENMSKAIDPYTQVKIKLAKQSNTYQGTAYYLDKQLTFSYKINSSGLEH